MSTKYDHKQIAKELEATANGDSYYGNALYVAKDMPWTTDNDRAMLGRWLNGANTASDARRLQDFAILTRFSGEMPVKNTVTEYYQDRANGAHANRAT
jgi:hypothetical protein